MKGMGERVWKSVWSPRAMHYWN